MAIFPVSVHPTASGSGLVSYISLAAARANWVSDTGVGAGDEGEIHIEGDWTSALDDSTVDWVGAQGPADVLRVIASPENYAEAEWDNNKWGLDCSDTASSAMTGADTHIELYGLQIRGASAVARGAWNSNAAGLMIFDGCHFSTALGRAIRVNGPTTALLRNFFVSGGGQYPIHCDNASAVIVAHNFVIRGAATYGVYGQNGSLTARNGIVEGAGTADFFGAMTREHCASSDGTATGTGCLANREFSFASATSGVLSPSDESGAIGGGVDLSADATLPVLVDIFGIPYLSPPSMGINEAGSGGGASVPLTGTTGGASEGSGSLSVSTPVAGGAAGAATASGSLTANNDLSGSATGEGVAAGSLHVATPVAGAAPGAAVAAGALTASTPLAGASAGEGEAAAQLRVSTPLAGSAAGDASGSAEISVQSAEEMGGESSGSTTASGSLNVSTPLSGTADGEAASSGPLSVETPLSGSSGGAGTASGELTIEETSTSLSGASAGAASATGALDVATALSGRSEGAGTAAAHLIGGTPPAPHLFAPPARTLSLDYRSRSAVVAFRTRSIAA